MNTTTYSSEPSSPIAPPLSPLSPTQTTRRLSYAINEREPSHPSSTAPLYSHAHPPQRQPEPQAAQFLPQTTFISQPPSQPFLSADSTDAIALRAAISSLQYQRQRASDDIRRLEQLKHEAVQRSTEFKAHLLNDGISKSKESNESDHGMIDDDYEEEEQGQNAQAQKPRGVQDIIDSIPGPLKIVRMPPINWDKYHVAAEPLERMHLAQQLRPGDHSVGLHTRENVIAAEYDALYDHVGPDAVPAGRAGHQEWSGSQGKVAVVGEDRKDSHGTPGMVTRRGSKIG